MAGGGGEGGAPLEYTPTWVVAGVCSVIVIISLALERVLHFFGKVTDKLFVFTSSCCLNNEKIESFAWLLCCFGCSTWRRRIRSRCLNHYRRWRKVRMSGFFVGSNLVVDWHVLMFWNFVWCRVDASGFHLFALDCLPRADFPYVHPGERHPPSPTLQKGGCWHPEWNCPFSELLCDWHLWWWWQETIACRSVNTPLLTCNILLSVC